MKEVVTVVTSLLVAGLSGGVFGALTGRKTAKDQLALEARKHQDELAAPKRTYQFDSLQAAVTALENAIVVTGSGVYQGDFDEARDNLRRGLPAVRATNNGDAIQKYQVALNAWETAAPDTKEFLVHSLTEASTALRALIAET